jgi:CRP-like cAMP-binding protein
MADILGKPRTCTVKAKGTARLSKIISLPIEGLINNQPDVVVKILKTLATRLERTTQKLSDHSKESPMWTIEGGKKPLA